MKKMILTVLSMAILLFITGCAQKTADPDFTKLNKTAENKYPEIAVVMTSEDLQYIRNRNTVMNALRESKMFRNISVDNPFIPFTIEVNLSTRNLDLESATGFGKGLISAGTLFLVPVDMKFNTKGYIKLRYKNVLFDEIKIDSDFVTSVSLYRMGSKNVGIHGSYRKALERALEEIKKRKSFEKLIIKPKTEDSIEKINI